MCNDKVDTAEPQDTASESLENNRFYFIIILYVCIGMLRVIHITDME